MFDRKGATADAAPKFNQPNVVRPVSVDEAIAAVSSSPSTAPSGVTVHLARPIVTHGGPRSSVVIREPMYHEFIEFGPISEVRGIKGEGEELPSQITSVINRQALLKWTCALTGLDRHVVGQLSPADAYAVSYAVMEAVAIFTQGNSPSAPMNSSSSAA